MKGSIIAASAALVGSAAAAQHNNHAGFHARRGGYGELAPLPVVHEVCTFYHTVYVTAERPTAPSSAGYEGNVPVPETHLPSTEGIKTSILTPAVPASTHVPGTSNGVYPPAPVPESSKIQTPVPESSKVPVPPKEGYPSAPVPETSCTEGETSSASIPAVPASTHVPEVPTHGVPASTPVGVISTPAVPVSTHVPETSTSCTEEGEKSSVFTPAVPASTPVPEISKGVYPPGPIPETSTSCTEEGEKSSAFTPPVPASTPVPEISKGVYPSGPVPGTSTSCTDESTFTPPAPASTPVPEISKGVYPPGPVPGTSTSCTDESSIFTPPVPGSTHAPETSKKGYPSVPVPESSKVASIPGGCNPAHPGSCPTPVASQPGYPVGSSSVPVASQPGYPVGSSSAPIASQPGYPVGSSSVPGGCNPAHPGSCPTPVVSQLGYPVGSSSAPVASQPGYPVGSSSIPGGCNPAHPGSCPTPVASQPGYPSAPAPVPESSKAVHSSAPVPVYPSGPASVSSKAPTPVPQSSKAVYPVPSSSKAVPTSSKTSSKPNAQPTGSYSTGGRIVTKGDKWAMTYTPYASDGQCKTAEEVKSDIKIIADSGFTTIRAYNTDCGVFENVVPECEKYGLKIIYGIFLEAGGKGGKGCFSDYANKQVQDIIDHAPKDSIAMIIVGNECMFNGFCQPADLAAYIDYVRDQLHGAGFPKDIAFTTTEPVGTWEEKGAALCDHIDVFTCQVHPFFTSTITADKAGEFAASQLAQAAKVCPEAAAKGQYISEIGWPSAGNSNGVAIASPEDQKIAMKKIMETVGKESTVFSFKDDPWKTPGALGVEQHFGCIDAL